jgi:hypothetical protein
MKTSSYTTSKKKWTSEQEALLDVLKQNPSLTEEQLLAVHDETQFRWILKQETNSSSSDTTGCLFIIAVIICAVLGFSFYESERRKESFENVPVNILKPIDPNELYKQQNLSVSDTNSNAEQNDSEQNNNTNFKDELNNIVKESAEEAISSTIVETLSGKSQSQTNSYPNCVWCGEEIKGTIYHVDYNGSQYDDNYYVSSTSGKGAFHYGCAYKICKKRR